MRHKTILYVKRVKARGNWYYYFDTGTKKDGKTVYKRLPDPSSREFGRVYAALLGHRTRRVSPEVLMTVSKLIELYEKSPVFSKLSPASRKSYGIHLRKVEHEMGGAPAAKVEPKDVTHLMDKLAETPGTANMCLAVIGTVYKWGRKRHHVPAICEPTRDVERLEMGEHQPWPAPVLNAALTSDSARVRLATHLLYYTAQRIGDVVKMRWSDIRDGAIHVQQQKTRKALRIPLHNALRAELENTPRTAISILSATEGGPIGDQAIRGALKDHCAAFGLALVPHGLRKNAVIALLEAGCSIAETASISGQTFQVVEHYAKLRDQGKLASAAVLKWQANES